MASTSTKHHHRLREAKGRVEELYSTGITRGVYLGFDNLHDYFSLKPKGTTYIYGSPFSGKTEVWFDILVNLSEFYGWHHAIYSPESGDVHEIYAEIISKYLKKPFYKNMAGHMTEDEMHRASAFVDEYFFIIDPGDEDLTIEGFFTAVDVIENEYGVKINTTCCDPFNELKHVFDDGRQDLYIENRLGFIRRNAMTKDRHNVMITHSANQAAVLKDGKRFYPAASPREISGGQAWYRKAMNLICIWRPPAGMIGDDGIIYEDNELHFIIQKYKPKGVGKKGVVKLYYDSQQNRFYEAWGSGRRYAGGQVKEGEGVHKLVFNELKEDENEF